MIKEISFTLNGEKVSAFADIRKSLLELLREDFGLTGAKEGCGVGECGACTVIIDGTTVDSCIYLASMVEGRSVTTIEGITNKDGSLTDVQQSYVDSGAVQCGFCTPGLIISSTHLLENNPNPNEAEIRRALSGNFCRCTGYQKIVEAVTNVADQRSKK